MTRPVLLLLLLAGCTSSTAPALQDLDVDDAGTCEPSLVGTWLLTSHDDLGPGVLLTNPPAEVYRLGADCTWSFTATGSDYEVDIPIAELGVDGGFIASTCDDLSNEAARFAGGCLTSGDVCACTYAPSGVEHSGTWKTSMGRLILSRTGNILDTVYEVDASSLELTDQFGTVGGGGVFTRQ